MRKIMIAAGAPFLTAISAEAQEWPSARPITLTLGFPPSSGADVVARTPQTQLDKALGQRIVVDYKAGAGGNVASDVFANAKPDGHIFLLGTAGPHDSSPVMRRCRALVRSLHGG